MSDAPKDKSSQRWLMVENYLSKHGQIANADLQSLLGVSPATANRILAGLVREGLLNKIRHNGHWGYELSE